MELILIGDSKLKIMLSDKDMEKYSLNIDGIDYDNTETRRAFWSILDDAKHRTGFDAAGSKISVQLFRCRSGGCEMFVTKINSEQGSPLALEIKENLNCTDDIYSFSSIDDLLKVLCILNNRKYADKSSVYYDTDNYYLILGSGDKTDFVKEYADRQKNKNYIYHILEHCDVLCINNAVEKLSPLY